MLKNRNKGSILVFILAILVLLSVICLRMMEETVQELRYVSQPYHRKELRMHAYSWFDATVAVLNQGNIYRNVFKQNPPFFSLCQKLKELEDDPKKYFEEYHNFTDVKLFSSEQQGDGEFISPIKVEVSLKIENEKLPYNIHDDALKALFGFMYSEITNSIRDDGDGEVYVDSLRDWEDSDDEEREFGAEDDFYEDEESPYLTPGRPIRNFEEFKYIKGFGPSSISSFDYDTTLFYDENGSERKEFVDFKENFSLHSDGPVFIEGGATNLPEYFLRFISEDTITYERILDIKKATKESVSPSEWRWHKNYIRERLTNLKIKISEKQDINLIRVAIHASKGQSNFQLHAILKLIKSKINSKHAFPFTILEIRENENLID